jgi:hypothetical protein
MCKLIHDIKSNFSVLISIDICFGSKIQYISLKLLMRKFSVELISKSGSVIPEITTLDAKFTFEPKFLFNSFFKSCQDYHVFCSHVLFVADVNFGSKRDSFRFSNSIHKYVVVNK